MTSPAPILRRRVVAVAAALVVVAGLVVLALAAFGGDGPPANGAARLAPKDTLVWVHVSTDTGRGSVEDADALLGRFDSYEAIRDGILERLAGTKTTAKDVEPWLGDEAALALVDAGQATAGSLVLFAVTDEDAARKFLAKNPRRSATREYKGDRIDEFGTVNVAFKDGYLLIGQSLTVQRALDRANGNGERLSDDATYKAAMQDLPEERAADAYLTAAGLRRILVPQGDVVGSLAALFDQPALKGIALAAAADGDRAKVTSHAILDKAAHKRSGVLKTFDPDLLDEVPQDAMAYFGVTGVSRALGNLVTAAAGGANAGGVGPVLEQLQAELRKQKDGARLVSDLLGLLSGEVALVLHRDTPAPTLALVTKVKDQARAREVLERVAEVFKGAQGAQLAYDVADGRLIVGTSAQAVRRVKDGDESLGDSDTFEKVESRSENLTSLGFLDFSQLLELGEQTGLNDSRAYLAAREDLQRVRAIGISSHGGEGETTAEILLSIP